MMKILNLKTEVSGSSASVDTKSFLSNEFKRRLFFTQKCKGNTGLKDLSTVICGSTQWWNETDQHVFLKIILEIEKGVLILQR